MRYIKEYCRTVNKETGKTTYFVKKCDMFQRVAKEDFDKDYAESDGLDCLFTETKGKFTRHYTTFSFYFGE